MNILIFSWRGPKHPNEGGAEIVTHEHAKAWVKNGHSVTLFTSSSEGLSSYEKIDGVDIFRRGNQLVGVQLHAFFWYIFQKKKFDVVFDHFHGIPFFTPLYVKAKKIGFIHEVAREVWALNTLPFYKAWLPGILGPIIEPIIFKLLYKNIPFITVSPSTQKDLIENGIPESNITIIKNGVTPPSNINIYPKEKFPTIMFLGAIATDKGIKDALEVFGKLSKVNELYRFWVVGKGDEKLIRQLKKYSKILGIYNKLMFYGFVSEKTKFELLGRAHILLNPSVHEGWGLVNIEASLMGTPVVAYDVAGIRDSVENKKTGLLVSKSEGANGLKGAIEKIIKDDGLYEDLSVNSKSWAKQFTWQESIERSLSYLDSLKMS